MHQLRFSHCVFYESDEFYNAEESHYDRRTRARRMAMDFVLPRASFLPLIGKNAKERRLDGWALLHAHGASMRKTWVFQDGKDHYAVQDWIDKHDGKYSFLMLAVCNTKRLSIHSEKSIVIHAKKDLDERVLSEGRGLLWMFVPGQGYRSESLYGVKKPFAHLRD